MNAKARKELEQLAASHRVLKPEMVIEFAKNKRTALHECFEWNESKAAHLWRLEQARALIRVLVTVEHGSKKAPIRALVSLKSDRYNGGGYRSIEAVMRSPKMYAELLDEALAELRAIQVKYQRLRELKRVFAAVDEVAARQVRKAA